MADLNESKKKLKEDGSFVKDLDKNKNTIDESELNEDELENVSGGYPKPYSHGSTRNKNF